MKTLRVIWTVLKAIGGFIVGATGVFGWLNITPEMVGQTTYDVMRLMWPAVMFAGGALSGWGITKIWSDRKMAKMGNEIAELEKRPTQKDLDDLKKDHAKAIADRDAKIANLKERPTQKEVDDLERARAEEITRRDAAIAKAVEDATRPLQERIDRIMNRENFALMRLRGLSLKELGIIKKFMTHSGEVMLKVDDASVRKLADAGAIRINSDTYSPPDLFPFTLDDSLRSLLIEFPGTLDKAIEEAEAVKSRYSGV